MATETIKMDMTWSAAARIYIAALEDGTAIGKQMAREEIMRMAAILDQLKQQEDAA